MTNFEQCALENSKDDPEILFYKQVSFS